MIQEFVDKFMANKNTLEAQYLKHHPEDYLSIVKDTVRIIGLEPERVHEIDDGDYQGMLLYLLTNNDYQPTEYWYVTVWYGSCSGCDTLQSICQYSDDPPSSQQATDYITLALHIVQGIKRLDTGEII